MHSLAPLVGSPPPSHLPEQTSLFSFRLPHAPHPRRRILTPLSFLLWSPECRQRPFLPAQEDSGARFVPPVQKPSPQPLDCFIFRVSSQPSQRINPVGRDDSISATNSGPALDVRIHKRCGGNSQFRKIIVVAIVSRLEIIIIALRKMVQDQLILVMTLRPTSMGASRIFCSPRLFIAARDEGHVPVAVFRRLAGRITPYLDTSL